MNSSDDTLPERYHRLWAEALPVIRANQLNIDPVLASGIPDPRRGLTLIARPGPAVERRILEMLAQLRSLEPDQYFYPAESLHVTMLSLFTASENHGRIKAHLPEYESAVESALALARPFPIVFRGITASADAVMVQGFPEGPMLEALRARLRQELAARQLSAGVDARYRIITAHVSVMRFRTPLRDAERFARALEDWRRETFGESNVTELRLIQNDWYASPGLTTTIRIYPNLGSNPPSR